MAELSISKERLNYTIDLLVTMAVEEISSLFSGNVSGGACYEAIGFSVYCYIWEKI